MRTLKTLAALGALLLVASSANATLTFTVHAENPLDTDSTQSFQLDLALSAGQTLGDLAISWAYTSGTPVGGTPDFSCSAAAQTMCAFGGLNPRVSPSCPQPNGQCWIWSSPGVGPVGPQNFTNIARFTLSGLLNGSTISLYQIEAFDASNTTITDIVVVPHTVTVIPEPTTVALLGLGLTGLGLAGARDPSAPPAPVAAC